jgi:hypothetical protein
MGLRREDRQADTEKSETAKVAANRFRRKGHYRTRTS